MTERKTIAIEEASLEQLREYAETVLGMKIHPNAKRETIVAKIEAANTGNSQITIPNVEVPIMPTEQATASAREEAGRKNSGEVRKVRILIETQEIPGGDQPVPVSVNGRAMLIPRGKEVDVPVHFVEALKNAVRDIYDPIKEGGVGTEPRKATSYPFRIIADPAPSKAA